jgi:hypothetical protein
MYEVWREQWADPARVKCQNPEEEEIDLVYFRVSGTLIACIAMNGTWLKRSVIILRGTSDEGDLGSVDWTQEDCCHQGIFVIDAHQTKMNCSYGGHAFFIAANCSAHRDEPFNETCLQKNIRSVFIPPRVPNQ